MLRVGHQELNDNDPVLRLSAKRIIMSPGRHIAKNIKLAGLYEKNASPAKTSRLRPVAHRIGCGKQVNCDLCYIAPY